MYPNESILLHKKIKKHSYFTIALYIGVFGVIPILIYFGYLDIKKTIRDSRYIQYTTPTIYLSPFATFIKQTTDETFYYFKALKMCENNGKFTSINKNYSQYQGGYQIGNAARTDVGFSFLNTKAGYKMFQTDSILQEEVMVRLLQSQIRTLYPYLKKYGNKNIGNYYITNSGILAMAHLCGPDAAIKFLTQGIISKDGNKVPITRYLQFNNFDIPIDTVLKENYLQQHMLRFLKQ